MYFIDLPHLTVANCYSFTIDSCVLWTELVWLCVHHDTKDFRVPRTQTYGVLMSSYNTYSVLNS